MLGEAMHEERPSYLHRSRRCWTNITPVCHCGREGERNLFKAAKEIKKQKKTQNTVSKTHAKKEGDTVSKEGLRQPCSQLCEGEDVCMKEGRIKSLIEVLSDFFFFLQLALRKTPLCATQSKMTMWLECRLDQTLCVRLFFISTDQCKLLADGSRRWRRKDTIRLQ